MEELNQFNDYLPISAMDPDEPEYIGILFKAFELSYRNGLYQFACTQLHMIFMVCIYHVLLKINYLEPTAVRNALHFMLKNNDRVAKFYGNSNKRKDQLYYGSFSMLGESDVFLLLKIIGMESDLQGEMQKFVQERNTYSHANGYIMITSQVTIDGKIADYVAKLQSVFDLMKPHIEQLYEKTITQPEFYDPEVRAGYADDEEQINEEFIKKYSITTKELNVCRRFSINSLSNRAGFGYIKQLHFALNAIYRGLSDDEA